MMMISIMIMTRIIGIIVYNDNDSGNNTDSSHFDNDNDNSHDIDDDNNNDNSSIRLGTVHARLLGVSGCSCSDLSGFWQDKF